MVHDSIDLSGIREQILGKLSAKPTRPITMIVPIGSHAANITIAFPLISPTGKAPSIYMGTSSIHMSGNAYTIVVRRMDKDSYQAIVVYGPKNRVFVAGASQQLG